MTQEFLKFDARILAAALSEPGNTEEFQSIEIVGLALQFIEDGTSGWNERTMPLDPAQFTSTAMSMAAEKLTQASRWAEECLREPGFNYITRLDCTVPTMPTLRFTNLQHLDHKRIRLLASTIAKSLWNEPNCFRLPDSDRSLMPYVAAMLQAENDYGTLQVGTKESLGEALVRYAKSKPTFYDIDGQQQVLDVLDDDGSVPFESTPAGYRDLLVALTTESPTSLLIVCQSEPDAELLRLLENLHNDFYLVILENGK